MAKRLKKRMPQEEALKAIEAVRLDPQVYVADPVLGDLASALIEESVRPFWVERESPAPYKVWGEGIEKGALDQMHNATRLPVAVSGALMPDAHQGYGLPIGGGAGDGECGDPVCRRRGHRLPDEAERLRHPRR
ncbi:MAG TPA: hypothetical protein VGR35_14750 [Tepidisphaeraceae bacterium]|nr:hypothetical protein [Tepidisphaeraceae bacterium]